MFKKHSSNTRTKFVMTVLAAAVSAQCAIANAASDGNMRVIVGFKGGDMAKGKAALASARGTVMHDLPARPDRSLRIVAHQGHAPVPA
jgi:hypothetical protein